MKHALTRFETPFKTLLIYFLIRFQHAFLKHAFVKKGFVKSFYNALFETLFENDFRIPLQRFFKTLR